MSDTPSDLRSATLIDCRWSTKAHLNVAKAERRFLGVSPHSLKLKGGRSPSSTGRGSETLPHAYYSKGAVLHVPRRHRNTSVDCQFLQLRSRSLQLPLDRLFLLQFSPPHIVWGCPCSRIAPGLKLGIPCFSRDPTERARLNRELAIMGRGIRLKS